MTVALKDRYTVEELQALSRDPDGPTDDDVTITRDGRRIDSKEKLLALIKEHQRLLEAEQRGGATR